MNDRPAPLVLGFDCGGTQTRVILASTEGRILGVGKAGASNINSLGLETTLRHLSAAVDAAWSEAGLQKRPADASFLGMAGIKASGLEVRLVTALCSEGIVRSAETCVIRNDSEPALAGGLAGRPGIVLIAGTGSYCQGRDATGRTAHCGGWGWLIDDVGSGFFLGHEAVAAVARSLDGRGPETSLKERIFSHAGLSNGIDFVKWLYATPPYSGFCASLAKIVTDEAAAGDTVARSILERGAAELAALVRQVAGKLSWEVAPEVVIVGGLGNSGEPYRPMIERAILEAVKGARISPAELPPVAGSVLRALEVLQVAPGPSVIARLREGCAGL